MNAISDDTYQAELLCCGRSLDMEKFRRLTGIPGYRTEDKIRSQVTDLLKTRNPHAEIAPSEIEREVDAFLSDTGSGYGVWAHYPWSMRLVRVLPEREFIELRTNRNSYKITPEEQLRLSKRKIGIIGLSVGQSVAITMALERVCGELRLADFDVIDLSNLNRLRCGVHNIGLKKTIVAAREISELDPYIKVICYNDGYNESNSNAFLNGLDIIVDECDSLDIKLKLREAAKVRRIPVLMNTSDRGMTDIERFDLEPDRPAFHDRTKGIKPGDLTNLKIEDKITMIMNIIGLPLSSVRLRSSMLEIEQSIETWPQLGSDVALGGAIICDAARRILLCERMNSGRYYMDMESMWLKPSACFLEAEEETIDHPIRTENTQDQEPCDVCERIIADAALAPSAGNLQPWVWEYDGTQLCLRHHNHDRSSVLYHDQKVDMVALGATYETALISIRSKGLEFAAYSNPAPGIVATISLNHSPSTTSYDEMLHSQIKRRRSIRTRPNVHREIPTPDLKALASQISRFPGMRLTWVESIEKIRTAAELIGEAERLRILDPAGHADMMSEIAWSKYEHSHTGNGIPIDSLDLTSAESAGLNIIKDPHVVSNLSNWKLGTGLGKIAKQLASSSSALGLIWTKDHGPMKYFEGGQALQRLWLEATARNIGLCPVTAICYLLSAARGGHPLTELQADMLPSIESRFRTLFDLPESRSDIVLFRLIPTTGEYEMPRLTARRPCISRRITGAN